jgi:hypothetical protein
MAGSGLLANQMVKHCDLASSFCHLCWHGLTNEFSDEVEIYFFKPYASALNAAPWLQSISVWSQSTGDWRNLSNTTFRPVSLHGTPSGSWAMLKSYAAEEIRRLAAMSIYTEVSETEGRLNKLKGNGDFEMAEEKG